MNWVLPGWKGRGSGWVKLHPVRNSASRMIEHKGGKTGLLIGPQGEDDIIGAGEFMGRLYPRDRPSS